MTNIRYDPVYDLSKAKNNSLALPDPVWMNRSWEINFSGWVEVFTVTSNRSDSNYHIYYHMLYIIYYYLLYEEKYSQWQGTGGTPRKTSPPGTLLSPRELEYPEKKRDCNFEQILHFEISNMAIIVTRQSTVTIIQRVRI